MFDPMLLSASSPISYEETSVDRISAHQVQIWRDAGIVVLAGSYISTFAPCNLSMGNEVSPYIWSILFDPVNSGGVAWPLWLQHDFLRLPFEVLTHCYPDALNIKRAVQRAFGTANYNPVHRLLAEELRTGRIRGILTTNYDMCLDAALEHTNGLFTIWDKPSWENNPQVLADTSKPYWKIHGSAHAADSLIVDLGGEARMAEWKQTLLAQLVRNRALLVIGYGGRDFEICPELAYSVHPRYVVWLDRNREVTPNAKRVLMEQEGTLVVGDLKHLLEKLFHFDATGLTRNAAPLDLPVDPRLLREWRIRLLDWMACGRLMLRELDTLSSPRMRAALTASAYGHIGRYRDGIRTIEVEARNPALPRHDQLQLQLSAASSWFIYGAHVKGWRRAGSIERAVAAERFSDLRVPVAECKLMMLMRFRQLARIARLSFVAERIRRFAATLHDETRKALEAEGNLAGLQALRLNAQRIGLLASGEMALPPIEGYASLGAIGMLSLAVRDAVRTQGPWRLLPDQKNACLWSIRNAHRYGWTHEEWKFRWILLVRGGGYLRVRHVAAWWKAFHRTQYNWLGRVFQIVNATILHT
jgi:hypothetical protein